MSTLGIVTIGQAPRDDIVELFANQAPAGTKVILRGALDGLSDAEVDALPPLSGADTLYTRLRGGRDVKISKQAVIDRSPGTLAKLRADGCDAIVYACTGEFPAMEGDAGVLFFSSGTTSLPKGIFHAQRALAIQWWRWSRLMDIDARNFPVRCWTGNGFFWSGNLSMVLGNALTTGGAVILQPVFQADEALTILEQERVSFPIGRPHQWARLEASEKWASTNLSSLHYVTYNTTLLKHPTVKTDWQLRPAYGTTETLTINTAVPANTAEADFKGSYGLPLPGNILKIVDTATGEIVPRGQRGEIGIKGPTLMLGYIGKTGEETFDREGYFMTGDGGYVDEAGRLFWEGRLTEIIKTGGANVSPPEIDAVIAAFPGVKLVQTVGVPHDTLGEMVVACVVSQDGVQLDVDTLRAYLKERLASFKVPRRVLLLSETEMPVTGNGKVKSVELRQLATQRIAAEGQAAAV